MHVYNRYYYTMSNSKCNNLDKISPEVYRYNISYIHKRQNNKMGHFGDCFRYDKGVSSEIHHHTNVIEHHCKYIYYTIIIQCHRCNIIVLIHKRQNNKMDHFSDRFRFGKGVSSIWGDPSAYKRRLRLQFPLTGSRASDFCTRIAAALCIHCCTVGLSFLPPRALC